MLKILRRKGVAKKILWFIAVVIIISFGFFGTAYLLTGTQQTSYAGTLFGKNVSFQEFEKAYRDVRVQALIRYGDQFNDYIQYRNLDADTWDRLILLYEANRRRIAIKDEDVINTVKQYGFFQRDGQFDSLLYRDIVRYIFKIEPREFEESIRKSLKLSRLFIEETFTANVLEEDIRQEFKKQNEKVQASYVFISPDTYKSEVSYNEEEAKAYYEEHKFDFGVPSSINVEYIQLPFAFNEDSLTTSATATAEDATPEQLEEKKKTAELAAIIYEELKTNPNMAEAAQAHGLTAQSSGFFSMENPNLGMGMSYELLKRLFELDAQEISEPYETSNGYFIAKVTEKKEAYVPEYEEAQEKVKDAVLRNAAMDITKKKAEELLAALKVEYQKTLPYDFANAAKALGLELDQTPVFKRGQYLPAIGISKAFQEAAFALTQENKISDVIEEPNGFYILHLDGYTAATEEEYEQLKDEIAQVLLDRERNEIFSEFLSRLRLESNLIDNISALKQQAQSQ
ncbi:MAG TPA: peptidyl-prolyl cis-trans isomerase [Candidatus Omnitrophota bacterium]|nr:peptidyl-prolyl cis-trans isomerase [Candidatus Omnitrophota bacterium]